MPKPKPTPTPAAPTVLAAPPERAPWLLALAFAAFAGGVQWWLVHDLRQLPSALFGGDWAYQAACIRAILATGNPLASPAGAGALPGYMPLYGNLMALVVRLTGLAVEPAMLAVSVAVHVLGTLLFYVVIARHFGRRTGLALALLGRVVAVGLVCKYTEFTTQLLVPFWFDALLLLLAAPRPRRALYLGLVTAALGYAHSVPFVGGTAIAAAALFATALARRDGRGVALRDAAVSFAIVVACALLALGYWWRPLFVFHGHTSPHYVEWNGGELMRTFGDRLAYARKLLGRCLGSDGPAERVAGVLALAGVAALALPAARRRFGAAALVALLVPLWLLHFFVTVPLLHTHFVPVYVYYMLWPFAALLLAAIPLTLLLERVPRGVPAALALGALVLIAAAALALEAAALARTPGMVAARTPWPREFAELQVWANTHTGPRDVVLSTNEISYAWCAVTGRTALVSRRAQNDPFLDLDVRDKDAALVLYGHDDAARRAALARWHVDWLLWTPAWVPSEFQIDDKGNYGANDPLLYFPNAAYDDELHRAGVDLIGTYTWVDPYLRGPEFPRFDLTIVTPRNYTRPARPWTRELDTFLEPAWRCVEGRDTLAVLYRVRRDAGAR